MKHIILRAFATKVLALMVLGASGGLALAQCSMPPLTQKTNDKLTPCNPSSTLHWFTTCTNSAYFTVTNWSFVGKSFNCTLVELASELSAGFPSCTVSRSDDSPNGTVYVQATAQYSHYVDGLGRVADIISTTFSLEIAASDDDGSGGSCPNCTSLTGAKLGTVIAKSEARPKVSFNLGIFSQSQSAGVLALDPYNASVRLTNPAALYVPYVRSNASVSVDVVTNDSGVVQQVNAPEGLINVVVVSAYRYDLQMFDSSKVTAKANNRYGTNGPAFAVWTVQNPDGGSSTNRLTVSQILTIRRPSSSPSPTPTIAARQNAYSRIATPCRRS